MKIKKVFDGEDDKVNKFQTKVPVSNSLKLSPGKKTVSKMGKEGNHFYVAIPIEDVCPELKANPPEPSEEDKNTSSKVYFRLISIGAMKIVITLRIEKRALNFDLSRGFGAITVLESLFTSLLNISDAPLTFKSLLFENVSHTWAEIQQKLTREFVKQLGFQVYKIFGSSDLLGNPVGFVSKLGSGFVEFLSEPSKGLLKSPKEFGKGIYKGSKALATGLISASFSSASGIGGSVYGILKSVSGQEIPYQRDPDTCWDGLYKGVVGGGREIVEGVTGIVTKPYEGAKEGPAGFAKGVGKGLCGIIVSPLTCSLK